MLPMALPMLSSRRTSLRGHISARNTNSESPEEIKAKSTGCRKPFRTWTFESSLLFSLLEQSLMLPFHTRKQLQENHGQQLVMCFKPKNGFTPKTCSAISTNSWRLKEIKAENNRLSQISVPLWRSVTACTFCCCRHGLVGA